MSKLKGKLCFQVGKRWFLISIKELFLYNRKWNEKFFPSSYIPFKKIPLFFLLIFFLEGQKKANIEEWNAEKKQFTDKIKDFKKDIKSLSSKLKFLHNPSKKNEKLVQQDLLVQSQKKVPLPKGAQNCDDGVRILDLQIIDLKKQNDLYHAKLQKKQQHYDKLTDEYNKLVAYKNEKSTSNTHPPETVEEDANRKVRLIDFRLKFCNNHSISIFVLIAHNTAGK